MSKTMVSLRFAPRMTRSYAQSVATSKGQRPDLKSRTTNHYLLPTAYYFTPYPKAQRPQRGNAPTSYLSD